MFVEELIKKLEHHFQNKVKWNRWVVVQLAVISLLISRPLLQWHITVYTDCCTCGLQQLCYTNCTLWERPGNKTNCVFHWYAGAGVQGRLFWVPPTEWLFRALRPSLCSESSPFLVSKFFTTLSACLCLSVACLSVCPSATEAEVWFGSVSWGDAASVPAVQSCSEETAGSVQRQDTLWSLPPRHTPWGYLQTGTILHSQIHVPLSQCTFSLVICTHSKRSYQVQRWS